MRFAVSVLFFIFTFVILNQAVENQEESDEDEDDNKKIDNIGGVPVPKGMYGFLIFYYLKSSNSKIKDFKDAPNDDSVQGKFLCSGTLLNRRWSLTRAKPLVYYKAHQYWLVTDAQFTPNSDYTPEKKYDVTWVAFHKKYKQTQKIEFDVAMVRTAEEILFTLDIRPASFGFSTLLEPDTIQANCRLIVWNWNRNTMHKMKNKEKVVIKRAEIPVETPEECLNANVNNETDYASYLNCIKQNLTESHFPFDQPCALNLGAPLVCGVFQQLWGVFVGDRGISECEGQTFKDTDNVKEYDVINIHKPKSELENHTTVGYFIGKILNKNTYVNMLAPVLGHFNLTLNPKHLDLGDGEGGDDETE